MKLVRFGLRGKEKPGLIDAEGNLRDLSGAIPDLTYQHLSPASLQALARIPRSSLPLVEGVQRLGVPVSGEGKFVAIGLNYADHSAESNLPIPKEPIIFQKTVTSLNGPDDDVVLPRGSQRSDWRLNSE